MRPSLEKLGRFDPVRARERFLSGFDPARTWRIERASQLVGFFATRAEPGWLLLDHLYLAPGAQGAGIGAQVIAKAVAEANAAGLPVRVGALRGSGSNRFYRRHGFALVEEAEFDNYYLRPGTIAQVFDTTGFSRFSWEGPWLAPGSEAAFAPDYWTDFMSDPPVIGVLAERA